MRYVNETPLTGAHVTGRLNFPGHSLTLIVKGTFDLRHGEPSAPAESPIFPMGDELYPDDGEMTGAPRYEYDFAQFKPRADLLLAGHCHPAGGKPVPASRVTFRVGPWSRSLYVFGDRFWKGLPGMRAISTPDPFTSMELRYENSFGGPEDARNPVGKGWGERTDQAGNRVWPLPNIEDPDHLIDSPSSRPEPAGFGPLGKMWKHRASLLGTYTKDWKNTRWPWYPADFDGSHFNAAPPQMQVEGYLRGDEPLFFENLHPEHPRYESRLPGLRARCFLNRRESPDSDRMRFDEVPMLLDTLWADMDNERLVLVWRGNTPVWSEDFEEVSHLFIMSERLDADPAPPGRCRELFLAALTAEEAGFALEPEGTSASQPVESAAPVEAAAASVASAAPEAIVPAAEAQEEQPEIKLDPAEIKARANAILSGAGMDMDALSPETRARIDREMDSLLNDMTETDTTKVVEKRKAELESKLADTLAPVGLDPQNPPPVSVQARQEQIVMLNGLGVGNAEELFQDPDFARMMNLLSAMYTHAGFDPENLAPLMKRAKMQMEHLNRTFSGSPDFNGSGTDQPPPEDGSGDEH